jgi:hypothetical protein
MLTDTQQHVGTFERSGRRGVRRTGAAVSATGLAALVAAGLLAAAPASAQPAAGGAPTFTHSAKRGEFRGGRLVLHGVARRVRTEYQDGRTDRVLVRRLHARLFAPGKPATGTLRRRGGKKAALRLSRPRYNAAKRTVSYRARPLGNSSVPRRFGRASLAMVAHPQVMLGDGQLCKNVIYNYTQYDWKVISTWTWNNWTTPPGDPNGQTMSHQLGANFIWWESGNSGFDRGCENNNTMQIVSDDPRFNPSDGSTATASFDMKRDWDQSGDASYSNSTSDLFNQYFSLQQTDDSTWAINQNGP